MRPQEDVPSEIGYLWPSNVRNYEIWSQVQKTEWRSDGSGVAWMDFSGVRLYLEEIGCADAEAAEAMCCIRAAVVATREVLADRAKERAAKQPRD